MPPSVWQTALLVQCLVSRHGRTVPASRLQADRRCPDTGVNWEKNAVMRSHDDVFDTPDVRQPTILAVYNQKGGVGKTTTAVNLSIALAALGKKVVLIDFDPQSSATSNFILTERAKVGIHDLLNQETLVEDAVTPTSFEGLSMIVGARKLYSLEHALDGRGGSQRGLRRALHFTANPPDYVVIDCPPALGHLAAGALAAADRLVLPVFPGRYALDGLTRTLSVVDHIQKGLNPSLQVAGILLMSVTNDDVGRESLAQLRAEFPKQMFRTAVPYDSEVIKATYQRTPAIIYSPDGRSAGRFLALAYEIIHGRGVQVTDEHLAPGLERIRSWHSATGAAYSAGDRRSQSFMDDEPAPGRSNALPKSAAARGDSRNASGTTANAAGGSSGWGLASQTLVLGFIIGVALGSPIMDAITELLN